MGGLFVFTDWQTSLFADQIYMVLNQKGERIGGDNRRVLSPMDASYVCRGGRGYADHTSKNHGPRKS